MYNKLYLVVTIKEGQPRKFKVVGPATFAWISSLRPRALRASDVVVETLPKSVVEEASALKIPLLSEQVVVTRERCENDRALACPGESFDSLNKAKDFIEENLCTYGGLYDCYEYPL